MMELNTIFKEVAESLHFYALAIMFGGATIVTLGSMVTSQLKGELMGPENGQDHPMEPGPQ